MPVVHLGTQCHSVQVAGGTLREGRLANNKYLSLIWGRESVRGDGFGESRSRTFIGRVQNCILVGIVDVDECKVITFGVQERSPASHCGLLSTMRHVQKATGSFKMQEVTVSNMEDKPGLVACPGTGPLSMNPLLSWISESIHCS